MRENLKTLFNNQLHTAHDQLTPSR